MEAQSGGLGCLWVLPEPFYMILGLFQCNPEVSETDISMFHRDHLIPGLELDVGTASRVSLGSAGLGRNVSIAEISTASQIAT